MIDSALLDKKLSLLVGYVADLEPLVAKIPADLSIGKDDTQLIERRFQLAVDTMIDINIHLIKEGNFGDPDDLQSTFKMLGDSKVLDQSFANKITPIVGARNMVVHQYEKIDMGLFLRNLKSNFSDFGKYITQINAFLKKTQD